MISLDQEKAFDRIEHNFIIQVLKKYKFPKNFITFVKIISHYIYSQVIVNGTFTQKIYIERSVRQGCTLSMLLYALALEPFIFKINHNINIKGIHIPNLKNELKALQHADDLTCFITTELSLSYLNMESKHFSKASGSKINDEKTEIRKLGKWKTKQVAFPNQLIKQNVKIFGIIYGENQMKENYIVKIEKIQDTINNWAHYPLNIIERIIITKTYILSLFHNNMITHDISNIYIKRINKMIYHFIWNGIDKLKRKTINQEYINGGLNMTDLQEKQKSLHIQNLQNMQNKENQPWVALFIYWFRLYMKFINPQYASNNYVHTLNIPSNLYKLKETLLEFRTESKIWSYRSLKQIYNYIIDKEKFMSNIQIEYPYHYWKVIREQVHKIKKSERKILIYKFINNILPTRDYLHKYKILDKIPKCSLCKISVTKEHIFQNCQDFESDRQQLKEKIEKINMNIRLDSNFFLTLYNDSIPLKDYNDIFEIMLDYISQIWKQFQVIRD